MQYLIAIIIIIIIIVKLRDKLVELNLQTYILKKRKQIQRYSKSLSKVNSNPG